MKKTHTLTCYEYEPPIVKVTEYESPVVEVIETEVEQGFATSQLPTFDDNQQG